MEYRLKPILNWLKITDMLEDTDGYRLVTTFVEKSRLPAGARLPVERALAAHLGISRAALRKGLGRLEAEGRIWRHVGQGTFIGPRPLQEPRGLKLLTGMASPAEVMEARRILEPALTRLAAYRATLAQIEEMEHCLRKGAAASTTRTFELWDSALHLAIAKASQSKVLLAFFDAVNALRDSEAWGKMKEATLTPPRRRHHSRFHNAIVNAIRDRDGAKAEALARQHLDHISQDLESAAGFHGKE